MKIQLAVDFKDHVAVFGLEARVIKPSKQEEEEEEQAPEVHDVASLRRPVGFRAGS